MVRSAARALPHLARASRAPPAAFEHIVVESTGLATPGPVVALFNRREYPFSEVHLEGVVTVVDAGNFLAQLSMPRAST